jgi:hypothetical protein
MKKLVYTKPALKKFGSVAHLTMAVGNSGNADVGGTGSMQKTLV